MAKIPVESVATQETHSAYDPTSGPQEILYLNLDQIALDPVTDVRVGPVSKDEEEKIDNLAQNIYADGQLQPVVVRPNGQPGKFLLVAGRRRYAAGQLIEKKSGLPFKIQAVLRKLDDNQAYAAALQENLQRKQFSPIEVAQNIQEIRKRYGWEGDDWTKHVAEFLRVSRATVSQHAKLLDLPAKIRHKVHAGQLSAQSAFELAKIEESQRDAVLARAEAEAEAEEKSKPSRQGKATAGGVATKGADDEDKADQGKVQHKHIVKAAREVAADEKYVKPRSRTEIVGFFTSILESADPYPDPVVKFCDTFVNKWSTGQVSDRSLLNRLDTIAEICDGKSAKKTTK